MRDVQKFLLVIGATALGAASFGLGVSCFLAVLPAGCRGIAGVGAAGLAMMLFAAGTALGAIVGFAAAVVRIRRHKSEPWKPTVWCGAGLGVLIGLVFYALSRLVASPPAAGVWESWPVAWARGVIAKLIAGDAFVTTRQESALAALTWRPVVWRPPAYFTTDWPAAFRSVVELARLDPAVAATGHGPPMEGEELRRGLGRLVRDFGRLIPHGGRYGRRPAVANRHGVQYVPPPVANLLPKVLAALALAGVATALCAGWRSGHDRRAPRPWR